MRYIRVTALEKSIVVLSVIEKGEYRDWKILEETDQHYFIGHNGDRTFITKEEMRQGRKDREPDLSFPLGLHFKLELIEKKSLKEKLLDKLKVV